MNKKGAEQIRCDKPAVKRRSAVLRRVSVDVLVWSWRQFAVSLIRFCALFIKWITICCISCHPPFKLVCSFITFTRTPRDVDL